MRFYLIIVELPQKYNFFRRNCHKNTTFLEETPSTLLFFIHGLQRVWRCRSFSIQRIRCPWLNVCCSQCRLCLVSGIHRCGGWRTRWQRCADRGDGNGRSWRGNPMRRGCWRKKKRSCGSDKSAHDLGRDKSKNASILRKYGSICIGKSQDYFIT